MSPKKRSNVRFKHTPLYRAKEPHALTFLVQRSSFWIATLSVGAFVVGNMVGQHGWYMFWKSVLGKEKEQIVYTGVVSPIEKVPDYVAWAEFGGDPHRHTYRQVPQKALMPLPKYDATSSYLYVGKHRGQVYSVGHAGAYRTGGDNDGSHPGVDIRVPVGTPIRSIANGIVDDVRENGSFGKFIVIKHTNVPDPDNPKATTTLYSTYAHLSAMYPEEGDIVQKGDRIGLSGQTGFASGPHLHFQMDREEAPWHPYWPFTNSEASRAGYSFTQAVDNGLHKERIFAYMVHPMHYIQADYPAVTLIANADTETDVQPTRTVRVRPTRLQRTERLRSRRDARLQARLARRRTNRQPVVRREAEEPSVIVSREEVVSAGVEPVTHAAAQSIKKVQIDHDGAFAGRRWEQVGITLQDANGNTITNPDFTGHVYVRTAYGDAEFRPAKLAMRDFTNGHATVEMLPRGRRTVVIQVQPFRSISKPMRYSR